MNAPSQQDKAAGFHALHRRSGAFLMPNPFDAGSARLLKRLGFEALATSSGASAATRGMHDGGLTPSRSWSTCGRSRAQRRCRYRPISKTALAPNWLDNP